MVVRVFGTPADLDAGTERWLFMPPGMALPQGPSGQMALQTTCAFLMAGMAFLLLTLPPGNKGAANAAGYLGSGNGFAEALSRFGLRYADETVKDWEDLRRSRKLSKNP